MSSDEESQPHQRLQYLLKHAEMRLNELSTAELTPWDIEPRELAILTVLAGAAPLSQLQAAQRLGIDRTTMVAMLDQLETKQLVSRRPDPDDRRRNVVELTPEGRTALRSGTRATEQAEHAFLAPLDSDAARLLETSLRTVLDVIAPPKP